MAGWVCPECKIDYDTLDAGGLAARIRELPSGYLKALTDADDKVVRTRPEPKVWSALEYAGHAGHEFREIGETVRAMATGGAVPDGADPDEEVVSSGYNEQAPTAVLQRLDEAAEAIATTLSSFSGDDWTRTHEFPWGERDVLGISRNAVHEGVHHLMDVENVLARVRG
ncbi:MAG: DinB family protein [Frankia sp.]|nr:DinB family protein [Frankia sp.]